MQVRFQSRLSRQRWSFIIMYRYVDGTASRRKRKSITSALYLSLSRSHKLSISNQWPGKKHTQLLYEHKQYNLSPLSDLWASQNTLSFAGLHSLFDGTPPHLPLGPGARHSYGEMEMLILKYTEEVRKYLVNKSPLPQDLLETCLNVKEMQLRCHKVS